MKWAQFPFWNAIPFLNGKRLAEQKRQRKATRITQQLSHCDCTSFSMWSMILNLARYLRHLPVLLTLPEA